MDHTDEKEMKKRRIISIIYLVLTVIMAVRGAFALQAGMTGVGMLRIVLAGVFLVAFQEYRKPPRSRRDED